METTQQGSEYDRLFYNYGRYSMAAERDKLPELELVATPRR